MSISYIFQQLGISLGLGLLVGLQRESVASRLAGLRTFALVTVFGTITALISQAFGAWVIVAGLVSLAALVVAGKIAESYDEKSDPGLTTEIALLLMYGVGAYLIFGHREVAIAVGGGTAVLLHFKGELHGAVARLKANDLKAIMQFVLISLVILPILPNKYYGPFEVLNPRNIWLMVVLIVAINLSGYVIYKRFGENAGVLLGGLLGGMISSTATTVSFSRRSKVTPDAGRVAAIIIMIASTVVFGRVMVEIAAISPTLLAQAVWPLLVIMAVMSLVSVFLWFWDRKETAGLPDPENPSELKSALLFGLLYAVIIFAVAFAKEKFGSQGLYLVAGISGLTDVDAITLSTAQMVRLNRITPDHGWRLITVAALSNLLFKSGTVLMLGHHRLLTKLAPGLASTFITGILVLLFW